MIISGFRVQKSADVIVQPSMEHFRWQHRSRTAPSVEETTARLRGQSFADCWDPSWALELFSKLNPTVITTGMYAMPAFAYARGAVLYSSRCFSKVLSPLCCRAHKRHEAEGDGMSTGIVAG